MTLQLPSWDEIFLVMPEVWLAVGMCAVILVPFVNRRSDAWPTAATLATLVLALAWTVATLKYPGGAGRPVLHGMLTVDPFSQFFKLLLILFTLLVVVQWMFGARRDTSIYDVPDFHCLLLGAAFGMALMASASNLLMIFVAIETASLPSFALAGFRKRHRVGTEGSLKYVIFGAASSAIMLYGMSLLYGTAGTLDLSGVAASASADFSPLCAVGLVMMFAGIAFKLSAVPLHFWCPDVFQGAAFEVTTFLSVASKGAAVALLLRILFVFGAQTGPEGFVGMAVGVAILGAATATWGNLLAYHQNNIKRLLAYSSIAHAGYMIMAASLMVLVRTASDPDLAASVIGAILFYLLIYMFMNLGAFTVASLVARSAGAEDGEDIRYYTGLMTRSPLLTVAMALFLLSLFGMPGLGGFMGKVYLMKAMADIGGSGGGRVLIAVLLINTLISLYYYMRPIYHMVLVADTANRPHFAAHRMGLALLLVCGVAILWTGLLPSGATRLTEDYGHIAVKTPRDPDPVRPDQAAPVPDASTARVTGTDP